MNRVENEKGGSGGILFPLIFFLCGILLFSINRNMKFVFWDEFLWYPDVLRVAHDILPRLDIRGMLAPTRWQYPPLFFLTEGLMVRILGEGEHAFRIVSILSTSILTALLFVTARRSSGRMTGLLAGGLFLTLPLVHRYGSTLLADPMQSVLIGASLFFFVRADGEERSLLPAALFSLLASSTKYTSFLLPVVLTTILLRDRFRGCSDCERNTRSWGSIILFTAIVLVPLLFLRPGDLKLFREMSFWRNAPFEWGLFFRLVPPPLLIAAVVAPFFPGIFRKKLRAPYLFLLVWTVFFFWRRQQINWFLPAVYPATLIAAHFFVGWGRRGRPVLPLFIAGTLLVSGMIGSFGEVVGYRKMERIYTEAGRFVDENVPPSDAVVVDALQFKSPVYMRHATIDVRDRNYGDGSFAILLPWVFENYRIRGFSRSAWGEVHETEIRDRWERERKYDLDGKTILEIYSRPE